MGGGGGVGGGSLCVKHPLATTTTNNNNTWKETRLKEGQARTHQVHTGTWAVGPQPAQQQQQELGQGVQATLHATAYKTAHPHTHAYRKVQQTTHTCWTAAQHHAPREHTATTT